MAVAIFITHFVLLLTFKLCPGERQKIGLQEYDFSLNSVESTDAPNALDHQFTGVSNNQKRFSCYICDFLNCDAPQTCDNAITCWKARVREADGKEQLSRGCVSELDQKPFICTRSQPIGNASTKKRHQSGGQYSVTCCQNNLCNSGDFPELPSYYLYD